MPFATVNNLKIHYREVGKANPTTLVCLHGISSNSRSWSNQLDNLAANFRVIAWDAPGYGQSNDPQPPFMMLDYATVLAGLLNALSLAKVVVVGLSMGGVLAQEFYRRYPEYVAALVLADTNTGGGARPAEERQKRLEARLQAAATLTPEQMAKQRAPALLSPYAAPEILQAVTAMISEIHPAGYRNAAIALDAADERDVLPTIAVPTLILWGEHDTVAPEPESWAIYQAVPNAKFKLIAGAGHLSNIEQPQIFNQAVSEFVNENVWR